MNEGFSSITRRCESDHRLGLSTYSWGKHPYSWEDFYTASGDREDDLFYCQETGRLYIPCQNELFIFNALPGTPQQKRLVELRESEGMNLLEAELTFDRNIFMLAEKIFTRLDKMLSEQDGIPTVYLKVRSDAYKRLLQLLLAAQRSGLPMWMINDICDDVLVDIDKATTKIEVEEIQYYSDEHLAGDESENSVRVLNELASRYGYISMEDGKFHEPSKPDIEKEEDE